MVDAATRAQCLAAARAVFEARVIARRNFLDGRTDPDTELYDLEMALYSRANRAPVRGGPRE